MKQYVQHNALDEGLQYVRDVMMHTIIHDSP